MIIKLYQHLAYQKNERVLATQILKSGTSIGANVEEALGGASKRDFVAKLTISQKETRETLYWLRLLKDSNIIVKNDLINDAEEILKILSSIIITSRKNLKKTNS